MSLSRVCDDVELPGVVAWLGLVLTGLLGLQEVDVCAARTLRVEKDGSGDYVEIQAAVDDSAPGDTVLVGPGRYTRTSGRQLPGGYADSIVWILDWPLTLRGTDSTMVFLGPSHPDSIAVPEPVGLYVWGAFASGTRIEGMTFENLYDGVIASASVSTVTGCAFRDNEQAGVVGIDIVDPAGMTVTSCSFERSVPTFTDFGVLGIRSRSIHAADCRFLSHGIAVEQSAVLDGRVERCSFESGWLGVQMDQGTTGEIRNRIEPGLYETVFLGGNATANLSGNAFHHGVGPTVHLDAYLEGTSQLNLTGNWWGTTDRDSIDAWIWDGNDDPSIKAVVEYEPILDGPLAAERKSFSSFKARFSPDH
jgi:hypothetical protein